MSTVVELRPAGALQKTVLRAGHGPPAGHGSRVRMQYSMRLSGAAEDDVFDSSSTRRDGVLEFTVGKRRVIPAVELTAESMAEGEQCDVVCAPNYAFGAAGLKRKNVPPNATIVLRAEMLSFEGAAAEKSVAEMTPNERFAKAEYFKECGNKLFKETKYEKALPEYGKAITLLRDIYVQPMVRPQNVAQPADEGKPNADVQQTPGSSVSNVRAAPALNTTANQEEEAEIVIDATAGDAQTDASTAAPNQMSTQPESGAQQEAGTEPETANQQQESANGTADGATAETKAEVSAEVVDGPSEAEVLSLHVRTLNNLSLCCFKLGKNLDSEQAASYAIQLDKTNFKAFYYRGRARVAMGQLEEARSDLLEAAKLKPQNMGIRTELDSVDRKLKVQKQKERKQAEAMFA